MLSPVGRCRRRTSGRISAALVDGIGRASVGLSLSSRSLAKKIRISVGGAVARQIIYHTRNASSEEHAYNSTNTVS